MMTINTFFSNFKNDVIYQTMQLLYVASVWLSLLFFVTFAVLLGEYSSFSPEIFLSLIIVLLIFLGSGLSSGIYLFFNYDASKIKIKSIRKNSIFLTLFVNSISILVCCVSFIYFSVISNDEHSLNEKISILFNFCVIIVNVAVLGLSAINLYSVSKKTQLETKEKNLQFEISILIKKLELFYAPIISLLDLSFILLSDESTFLKNSDEFNKKMIETTQIITKYRYLGSPESLQLTAECIQLLKKCIALILSECGKLNYVNEHLKNTKNKDEAFKEDIGNPKELKLQYLSKLHQNKMKILEEIRLLNENIESKNNELFNLTKT